MDIKGLTNKLTGIVSKYKYAVLILLIGIALLLMPYKNNAETNIASTQQPNLQTLETSELTDILESIQGAGKVKVLLSFASGEETRYQIDIDSNQSTDNTVLKHETVILTDADRGESGLINQVNPPKYLGAIVVCEGADSASVKLAITQAVAKITGLGTDNICVLKMES